MPIVIDIDAILVYTDVQFQNKGIGKQYFYLKNLCNKPPNIFFEHLTNKKGYNLQQIF